MKKNETLRQCCITKEYFPRQKLSRIIRKKMKSNDDIFCVFFEKEIDEKKSKGRSLHFLTDEKIFTKIFHKKKLKMIEYFLQTPLSLTQWKELCNNALNSIKNN